MSPFSQSTIVEHLEFVCDNERHNAICQAFLEHQQPPNSAVSILKRMNLFEANMKIKDVIERMTTVEVVVAKQTLHV